MGECSQLKNLLCYLQAAVLPATASDTAAGPAMLPYGYHGKGTLSLDITAMATRQ